MKLKQSNGQNQRIERITTSHLVIGIGMAKETHVALATCVKHNTCIIILLTNIIIFIKNTILVIYLYYKYKESILYP